MQRHILHEFMTGQDSAGAQSYLRLMKILVTLTISYTAGISCFLYLITD